MTTTTTVTSGIWLNAGQVNFERLEERDGCTCASCERHPRGDKAASSPTFGIHSAVGQEDALDEIVAAIGDWWPGERRHD